MQVRGWITRTGPDGWDIVVIHEGRIGRLPRTKDDFEIVRQAAELLMSSKDEGTICGGNRKIPVRRDTDTQARIVIVEPGLKYVLKENIDPKNRTDIDLSVHLPFEFEPVEELV